MKPQAPCQNPACFKPPPAGSKWPACSGCGRTFYCSKKCQKEHWKSHKSLCQMNQKTVNKIEGVKYSPPGGGDSSKAEVKRPWIGEVFLGTVKHIIGRERVKDHPVLISVDMFDTLQKEYTFTYKSCSWASFETLDSTGLLNAPLEEFRPKLETSMADAVKALPDLVFVGWIIVYCGKASNMMPIPVTKDVWHEDSPNGRLPPPNFRDFMVENFNTPGPLDQRLIDKGLQWLEQQRAYLVFCCVHLLDLKSFRKSPQKLKATTERAVEIDLIFRKTTSRRLRWTPLYPRAVPWSKFKEKMNPISQPVAYQLPLQCQKMTGTAGVLVICYGDISGSMLSWNPVWVSNAEIDAVEEREDWKLHAYRLLLDYDLKESEKKTK